LPVKLWVRLPRLPRHHPSIAHRLRGLVRRACLLRFDPHVLIASDVFSRNQPGRGQHLDPVADREYPLPALRKLLQYFEEASIVPQVFRRPASQHQHRVEIRNFNLIERNVRIQAVPWTFHIGVPPWLEIVRNQMKPSL